MPTLAQLTTAEQRWADREEDITTVGGDPYEVGQVFARRWMGRLGDHGTHLQKLSGMYPRVPHRIDGELLRYAARFGLLAHKDDQIDEHDRYAIRAGFWREIDVRTAAEHAPAGIDALYRGICGSRPTRERAGAPDPVVSSLVSTRAGQACRHDDDVVCAVRGLSKTYPPVRGLARRARHPRGAGHRRRHPRHPPRRDLRTARTERRKQVHPRTPADRAHAARR